MRKTTRRKYYGRSSIAGSLRTAASELAAAITEAEKPPAETPLSAQLRKVAKSLDNAIESEKVYALQRKRIKTHLERERKHIQQLLDEVLGVAVLPDEKTVAKQQKNKG